MYAILNMNFISSVKEMEMLNSDHIHCYMKFDAKIYLCLKNSQGAIK